LGALRPLALAVLFVSLCASAQESDKSKLFRDPQDGAFDASEFLLDKKGFLPVPIVITEPAVGYGAGAALVFFRESLRERASHVKPGEPLTPPDIYIAAMAATENGTKVMGGGGLVTFAEDRYRWRGFVGLPDVNLDFYGVGGQTGTGERKIGYNIDGVISTQQLMRRLGNTNNWIVGRWIYLDLDATFDSSRPLPVVPGFSRNVTSSGLGGSLEHDSRDNFFSAGAGWKGSIEAMFYSPDWGSDNTYETYRALGFGYVPAGRDFVLGAKADVRSANGDVPFYQLPFIELRGVPVARYQDRRTFSTELELRWNATPRWSFLGFLGSGRAWGSGDKSFGDAGTVTSGGVGFRYLVARRLGILAGLDLAKSAENTAIYIQAGSAWR
jgi:hypothetical protein